MAGILPDQDLYQTQLNARGLAAASGWLTRAVSHYRYLAAGEFLDPDQPVGG